MDFTWLTKKDVEVLNEKVNLTDEESEMLEHLRRGRLNDDGIMLEMHLGRTKYYKTKGQIENKILVAAARS